ncbi:hypothetical protein KY285_001358 [Solanum tuberosum]|nr:hypothetical protein KY285_001358 [Solanum tuberosum]
MGDTTPSSGTTTNPTSIIAQQDNSPFLMGVILDETNFSLWSQLMEMRIGARNKVAYLTGEAKKPEQTDSGYAIWITENHKAFHGKGNLGSSAKTFYDGSDETRLFELNQKSVTTMQNGRPLSMYYNKLVAICQEIGHQTNTHDGFVEGILHMHSMMARLRVHIFLNGLDAKFDQVCGEILRKDPKLDLESAYVSVRREAQQRQTMGSARLIPNSFAMAFHHSISVKGRTNQSSDWWDFLKKPRKVIPNRVVATTTSGTN